jgi:hypothetical protein
VGAALGGALTLRGRVVSYGACSGRLGAVVSPTVSGKGRGKVAAVKFGKLMDIERVMSPKP